MVGGKKLPSLLLFLSLCMHSSCMRFNTAQGRYEYQLWCRSSPGTQCTRVLYITTGTIKRHVYAVAMATGCSKGISLSGEFATRLGQLFEERLVTCENTDASCKIQVGFIYISCKRSMDSICFYMYGSLLKLEDFWNVPMIEKRIPKTNITISVFRGYFLLD